MTKADLTHASATELFKARTIIQRRIRDDMIALGALERELHSIAKELDDHPPRAPLLTIDSYPIPSVITNTGTTFSHPSHWPHFYDDPRSLSSISSPSEARPAPPTSPATPKSHECKPAPR